MLKFNFKQIFSFIIIGFIAISCDDDPVSSPPIPDGLSISYPSSYISGIAIIEAEGQEEDHGDDGDHGDDIAGFKLELEGDSDFVYKELNGTPEGSITISLADGSKELSFHFLDSNGDEIDHEEHCDELAQVDCESSDHCVWNVSENICEDSDHGSEEHGMHIEITPVGLGTTYFQILLMHNGHSDFTSLGPPTMINGAEYNGIPVTVVD